METLALDRSIHQQMSKKRYSKHLQCIDAHRDMLPCFSARCSRSVPVCHVSCPANRTVLHAQERDGVCRHRMYCCGCARSPGWSTCGGDVTTKWNSKVGTPALCFLGKWV